VAAGDVLRVRQLLREHPPHHVVDAVDHVGWCTPHCYSKPPPLYYKIISLYGGGRTGLMVAVEARHVEMVELLLASGADPHHRSSVDGMHALHVLAEESQRRVCRVPTPNPPPLDPVRRRSSSYPHTWHSAKAAERVLLQVLLDSGVDPNVPTTSSGEVHAALLLDCVNSLFAVGYNIASARRWCT
jgi:hypothetical protein